MPARRYRWVRSHAIEGLCGEGHVLHRSGCAKCGPTVALPERAAATYIQRGLLVPILPEEAPKTPVALDQMQRDIAAMGAANAALQAEVLELRAARDILERENGELAQRTQHLEAENARLERALRDQRHDAPVEPVGALLDKLQPPQLRAVAERVREEVPGIPPFTGKGATSRARVFLDGYDPVAVRAAFLAETVGQAIAKAEAEA